jgi:hypothetical protein
MNTLTFWLLMGLVLVCIPALAIYLLLKLTDWWASRSTSRRLDRARVRAYVVSAILFAADFWMVGVACYSVFYAEPRPLFAEEPKPPLVLYLLPLAGVVIGTATISSMVDNSSPERLQRYLPVLGIVSGAIIAACLFVLYFEVMETLG